MTVGGLIAIIVLQADILAVATFPADLLDHAVARGENRRAIGGRPVDASVHLDVAQDRVTPATETGPHDGVIDGFADQEFLRALAALVIVVDDGVVGGLEAIVLLGFAADGERGEQHLVLLVGGYPLILAGIEYVKGIAGLDLALEIHVIGVDADHVVDDRHRHLVAQRRLVDALVEAHASAVVVIVVVIVLVVGDVGDGVDAGDVDGDIFAEIGKGGDGFHHGVVGDDDAE